MPTITADFSGVLRWITENWNAIGAGIIASIIVLLFQTLIRALALIVAAWANKTLMLSPVWGFSSITRLYVVSGSIEGVSQEVRNAILMGPDADAANESITTARLLNIHVEISRIYSPNYPDELLKEDIISVGGPVNNSVTRKLMSSISSMVSFEDFILQDKVTGRSYEATYEADDTIVQDYGLILKLPNPLGLPTEVLIIAGCDTHGVLAAARSISLHPDGKATLRKIRSRLGLLAHFRRNYYMAIIRCKAVGNEVGNLELIDFHALKRIGENLEAR